MILKKIFLSSIALLLSASTWAVETDSVFHKQGYRAAVEMTIRMDEEAANERYVDFDILGFRYLEIDNYEKALDYYEKAYEIHHPNMPYIGGLVLNYDKLKDNPRYLELLKKMNLPLRDN